MTPAEVKFNLDRKLGAARITGTHSIVMIDPVTVSVIFDIEPDADGSGLYFEFATSVPLSREEIAGFLAWLVAGGERTVH